MIFGLGYNPESDAKFIIKKFKELKEEFHKKYLSKKILYERDFETYLKQSKVKWDKASLKPEVAKISPKEKITMKNEIKFKWYYKSNDIFRFHLMPMMGFSFRCYSLEIEGFDAVMDFKGKKIEYLTREYLIGFDGEKQSSTKATKLMERLIEKDRKFVDVSNMHF